MAWNYQRNESSGFEPIPEGPHRIRIKSAEKAVSKNGSDMLALQFDVSGFKGTLYHYIVFLQDKPEITNRNLTQFFDAFKDIPDGEFDMTKWIGKCGACSVKHEEYNGNKSAKVAYFIKADKQNDLPAWKDPDEKPAVPTTPEGFMSIPEGVDEELPF